MSPGLLRRLGALSALAWAFACNTAGAGPADPTALHGAMAMDAQQSALDQMKTGLAAPPGWVESEVWHTRIPADNQPGLERIALGRSLYFDLRLSADGTVSCATCHDITRGLTDRRPVAEGIRGRIGRRNAPTTANVALLRTQFRDGRAGSLEEQALLPITNPIEMGHPNGESAVRAIADDPKYQLLFQLAYGRPPNYADIGRAIASFERTLVFLDAPFDRFLGGDENALSASAQRGWSLFNGRARCATCHPISASSPLGSDDQFHNIGVSARHQDFDELVTSALASLEKDSSAVAITALALQTDASELGRFLVTRDQVDIGAFRTPQLRNVGVTGPYMHDGSLATLWDVVDHYNKGGEANRFLDGGIEPLGLTEEDVGDLVEFMFSMTDLRFATANQAERVRQRKAAEKHRNPRNDDLVFRRTVMFEARVGGSSADARKARVGGSPADARTR